MKAMVNYEYGSPDVVEIKEVEDPVPQKDEILIRIYATTVTSADSRLRSLNVPFGFGLMVRMFMGFGKPKKPILGVEFAGEVVAVGENVEQFQAGDRVFGGNEDRGCHAEYMVMPEHGPVAKLPPNVTFDEAAAIPFGALTSLVFLRDFGKIRKGQKVLINGASGSLGVYGVQLAKHFGGEVTAVCSGSNTELVKSLGADKVVDYTKEDFTQNGEVYDIIYDTVGKIYFSHCKGSLAPGGRFLAAVAGIPQYLKVFWTSLFGRKKLVSGVAVFKKEELLVVKDLIESGDIKAVIDRQYSMEQIAEAHRYVDLGHKKGSVVVTIDHSLVAQ